MCGILNINDYLQPCEVVDFSEDIKALSSALKEMSDSGTDYIKSAFEYVRDNISHSADIKSQAPTTCKASEVLKAKHGICYAKSHLLAALLRYQKIPAAFCYQRLILCDETAPYLILHGLNAVYIQEHKKWIRLDPRGNKPGIDAQFSLEKEKPAFYPRPEKGEEDIPEFFTNPDKNVVKALTENKTLLDLWGNLPRECAR